jgi:hypothetical protein
MAAAHTSHFGCHLKGSDFEAKEPVKEILYLVQGKSSLDLSVLMALKRRPWFGRDMLMFSSLTQQRHI